MSNTLVATCRKCRAWYNMDMEPHMPDEHFDMRTGEPCYNEDDWYIVETDNKDWRFVN